MIDNTGSIDWNSRVTAAAKPLNLETAELEKLLAERIGLTRELGVAALDDDEVFKFGDFREAFKDKPIAVLRIAFRALRGGTKETKSEVTGEPDERTAQLKALGFKVKLEDAPVALLLPLYAPDKPSDPVTVALKKRFGDKPIIAFREDGAVAVTETVQYISDLEQGFPARDTVMVSSQLAKLWPVGAKPNTLVEEDPLFPGQPLRNGYSIVNNRNWTKVPFKARQLCRMVVERGDIDPENKEAVLRLLERAETPRGLQDTYPEAALDYREREQRDELPKLKVVLGAGAAKPQNPFGVRRQY